VKKAKEKKFGYNEHSIGRGENIEEGIKGRI
jgi:hypothetical protein